MDHCVSVPCELYKQHNCMKRAALSLVVEVSQARYGRNPLCERRVLSTLGGTAHAVLMDPDDVRVLWSLLQPALSFQAEPVMRRWAVKSICR